MKKKIYKNIELSEELESLIKDSEEFVYTEEEDLCDIRITDDDTSDLRFTRPLINGLESNIGYLDKEVIASPLLMNVAKNYLEKSFYLRPEGAYSGILVKNNSLKVLDKSSYGLYSDYICSEANNFSFNTRVLRKCLTSLFVSFDRLSIVGGITMPLEIDYGRSQDAFFTQFSCNMTPVFKMNLVLKSIAEYVNYSDCVEVSLCHQTKRLVVRSFWLKNITKKWTSLFIYESGTKLNPVQYNSEENVVKTHIVADVTKLPVIEEDEAFEDFGIKKQWSLIRLTIKTIISLRDEYVVKEKDFPTHFNDAIVNSLLEDSEYENTFSKLEEHEKEIVIDFLSEEDPLESLKRMRLGEMIEIEPNDYIDSIYTKVDEIEYDKLKSISGEGDDEEEVSQTIKGSALEKEKSQLIKGDGPTKVDNSVWEIKKLNVAKNLKEKYDTLENPSPQEIEEIFETAMKESLSASDANVENYVDGVVDSISEKLLPASVPNSKFINKTMGRLKNRVNTTDEGTLDVSPLELKLMLSFTEKLIRKGENFEQNLKFESEKNQYLKKQVNEMSTNNDEKSLENPISAQMRIANDRIIKERDALIDEKNQYKNKIFELERLLEKSKEVDKVETKSETSNDFKQEKINKLTENLQAAKAEALDFKRQLKINEKDMIKLKTQMARLSSADSSKEAVGTDNSKTSIRIKQLEKINDQYLSSKSKMEKELAEKKSEIHSARLESKTMANKVKQLEKKVELLSRRKAS